MKSNGDKNTGFSQSEIEIKPAGFYPTVKKKDLDKLKNEKWTRVIDVSKVNLDELVFHSIKEDLTDL
jgi:hypothetical protein